MLAVQRGAAAPRRSAGLAAGLVGGLLVALAAAPGLGAVGLAVGGACGAGLALLLARAVARERSAGLGPADVVTLARAALSCGVAGLVADGLAGGEQPGALLVALAGTALVLDAVDGRVARRTGTGSPLGARFDGEADAFLIAVLSVEVARTAGPLVLGLGGARYAFLVGGALLPWLRAPLPPRYWRKVVAAAVGAALLAAASRALPVVVDVLLLGAAGALLAESFGRDVVWLWRRRPGARGPSAARPRRPVPSAGGRLPAPRPPASGPPPGRPLPAADRPRDVGVLRRDRRRV